MLRTCTFPWCRKSFIISDQDQNFYETVSPVFNGKKELIPPPTLCPTCRQQRRLAWRNEHNLYSRICDLCRHHIISTHRPDSPYPVYCLPCWWSDRWNPLDFGVQADLNRPFMEQFLELQRKVPQLAIQNDNGITSENSEYCYDVSRAKNCYRLVGSWYDEDCHYSLNVNRSRSVIDCNTVSTKSELVYESLDSQRIYHCAYVQNCDNCRDCFVCADLRGCSDCVACFGLRHKRFCMWNEQFSEDEYRRKLSSINLASWKSIVELRTTFDGWALRFPRLYANLQSCEECIGNNLFNCKGVLGYNVFSSEESRFIDRSDGPKYCYDLINTGGSQWCLDCVTSDDSYGQLFSAWCWKCRDVIASDNCHSCDHMFGCIAARRNKYCILNKQYTKEEYETLAAALIDRMRRDGTWGEHLPLTTSMYAYNESAAMEYYPLDRTTVLERGWRWVDDLPYVTGKATVTWDHIPDTVEYVPESITNEVLSCMECQRNFKIILAELALYRKIPAPLPRFCPYCRHRHRFARKTPTELWPRTCSSCRKQITTSYSPKRPEKVVCEECYLKQVY